MPGSHGAGASAAVYAAPCAGSNSACAYLLQADTPLEVHVYATPHGPRRSAALRVPQRRALGRRYEPSRVHTIPRSWRAGALGPHSRHRDGMRVVGLSVGAYGRRRCKRARRGEGPTRPPPRRASASRQASRPPHRSAPSHRLSGAARAARRCCSGPPRSRLLHRRIALTASAVAPPPQR